MADDAVRWAFALDGAREAVERIKTTYRDGDSRGAAEAAFWVSALESELAEPHGGTGDGSSWARRCEREGYRDLLGGLRFVRNHAAHGLAHLAELGGGLTLPFALPFTIEVTMLWQRDDLPAPRRHHEPKDAPLRESYTKALAGQDVRETLGRAVEWLGGRAAEEAKRTRRAL